MNIAGPREPDPPVPPGNESAPAGQAPTRPALRVVRGDPAPEELAALTAILAAPSGGYVGDGVVADGVVGDGVVGDGVVADGVVGDGVVGDGVVGDGVVGDGVVGDGVVADGVVADGVVADGVVADAAGPGGSELPVSGGWAASARPRSRVPRVGPGAWAASGRG